MKRSICGGSLFAAVSLACGEELRMARQNGIARLPITDLQGKDYLWEASGGLAPSDNLAGGFG